MAAMMRSCQFFVFLMIFGLEAHEQRLAIMRSQPPTTQHVAVDVQGDLRVKKRTENAKSQQDAKRKDAEAQARRKKPANPLLYFHGKDVGPRPLRSNVFLGDTPGDTSHQMPKILHVGSILPGNYSSLHRWHLANPGWKSDILNDKRIMDLAAKHSPQAKAFLETGVRFGVEKSDIGRLLALEAEGGLYFDSDVRVMVPMSRWLKQFNYTDENYDLIFGIETPDTRGTNPLQITNWAMAAMPGNSILSHTIDQIVQQAPSIPDTEKNIVQRTGPGAMTSALLESFQHHGLTLPDMSEFKEGNGHLFHLKEENGNEMKVLVLPYRAFGMHPGNKFQFGANSFRDNLVKHDFLGRWRTKPPKKKKSRKEERVKEEVKSW